MSDLKERVEEMTVVTTRNFYVSNCPEKIFQRFVKFSKTESADNYSMAIGLLLDVFEANAKELVLFEKLQNVENRLADLEVSPQDKKEGPRRFGGKE